jgi:hypothetical protein
LTLASGFDLSADTLNEVVDVSIVRMPRGEGEPVAEMGLDSLDGQQSSENGTILAISGP